MAVKTVSSYKDEYIIKHQETAEFFVWFKSHFGEEEAEDSAVMHYMMIDHMNGDSKFKGVEATRGGSKSTLVGVYYSLFNLWKGRTKNIKKLRSIVYVMDTQTKATSILERIIKRIQDYPDVFKDRFKVIKTNLGNDPMLEIYHYKTKTRIYMFPRGMGQSIRGTNKDERPDIIYFDDIESEVNGGTKEARIKNRSWFFANALPAGKIGHTEFIFIGTPITKDCLLKVLEAEEDGTGEASDARKTAEELGLDFPEWDFIRLPLTTTDLAKVSDVNEIDSCWEQRFPPREIMRLYLSYIATGEQKTFFQEYLLKIIPAGDKLYQSELKKYSRIDIENIKRDCYLFISTDFSAKDNQKGDLNSICVIGIHRVTKHWFIFDGVQGHFSTEDSLFALKRFMREYKIVDIVMENVAFQNLFHYIFEKEFTLSGIFYNIIEVHKTINKFIAFKGFTSIAKTLWIPDNELLEHNPEFKEWCSELKEEMDACTRHGFFGEYDDVLDSVVLPSLSQDIIAMVTEDPYIEDNSTEDDYTNPYDWYNT